MAFDAALSNFKIDLGKASASSGEVTFDIQNNGPSVHEFVVLKTDAPDQLPTTQEDGVTIGDEEAPGHDLGHASATLLSAGVHPKVASEALGHSSVSFTMDTYQHLMPTMQDAATRAIEEALGGAIGGTVAAAPDKT
jgi:hypothetical protein